MADLLKLAAAITGAPLPAPPDLVIPDFCRIPQAERKAAWARYDAAHGKTQTQGNDLMKTAGRDVAAQVKKLRTDRATKGPRKIGGATLAAADKVATAIDAKPGEISQDLAEQVTKAIGHAPVNSSKPQTPTATAAAKPKEDTMKTKLKAKTSTKSKAKKTPAAARAKAPGASKAKAAASARTPVKTKPAKPETKADIIQRMLVAGTTRKALSEATGYPHVNLKMAAERAKMKLVEDGETVHLVAKP